MLKLQGNPPVSSFSSWERAVVLAWRKWNPQISCPCSHILCVHMGERGTRVIRKSGIRILAEGKNHLKWQLLCGVLEGLGVNCTQPCDFCSSQCEREWYTHTTINRANSCRHHAVRMVSAVEMSEKLTPQRKWVWAEPWKMGQRERCSSVRQAWVEERNRSMWDLGTSREWSAEAGAGQHKGMCRRWGQAQATAWWQRPPMSIHSHLVSLMETRVFKKKGESGGILPFISLKTLPIPVSGVTTRGYQFFFQQHTNKDQVLINELN